LFKENFKKKYYRVIAFISSDVTIDVPDKFGFSPLMQASVKGYVE